MEKTAQVARACKVKGCKRLHRAKGYCNVHFRKWRRGEIEGARPRYKICGEENCRKPMHRQGLCEQHYSAWSASKKPQAPQQAPQPPAAAAPAEAAKAE